MPSIRYHVKPRDAPASVAARALGLTLAEFEKALPELLRRRFPSADPTTGMYDLVAIEKWQDARHPRLLGSSDSPSGSRDQAMNDVRNGWQRLQVADEGHADGEWEERVRKSPLGKRERAALAGYYAARGGAVHVNGAGLDTIARLEARGFVQARGDGFGVSNHSITPAGEAEWLRIANSNAS